MYNYSWKEAGPGDLPCMLMTMVSKDNVLASWGRCS